MSTPLFERLSALAEPIRVRLLRVLAYEELAVGEIARVLQVSQPTVSRHLKLLDQGGWVLKRRAGTATYLRLAPEELEPEARSLWELVLADVEAVAADPASLYAEDLRRLHGVVSTRSADSLALFHRLAGRWDTVRRELFGESFVLASLVAMLPEGRRVADLGCGTGVMLPLLAPGATWVVGVDREAAMLEVAAQRTAGLENVRLVEGLLDALPLESGTVDLALCHLVLHHIRDLAPVFAEAARILAPAGRFVILDMAEHDRDEYRDTMGHQHLGFSREALEALASGAGLRVLRHHPLPADPDALGPSLFVAVLVG